MYYTELKSIPNFFSILVDLNIIKENQNVLKFKFKILFSCLIKITRFITYFYECLYLV